MVNAKQIHEAAVMCAVTMGIDNVTFQAVADTANVSKASVVRLYGSVIDMKETIVAFASIQSNHDIIIQAMALRYDLSLVRRDDIVASLELLKQRYLPDV